MLPRIFLSLAITLVLGLLPLMAEAVVPDGANFLENKNRSGKCGVFVNYSKGAVKSRQMNVADVKWLISQPGGVAMFADISPKMNKVWLEKLIAQNDPMKQFAIEAPDGSKACRTLSQMADRLDQRAKAKAWADEDSQSLIIGSLQEANYPPFEESGPAPARASIPRGEDLRVYSNEARARQ